MAEKYYGQVTKNNLKNFEIGQEYMNHSVMRALLQIKVACARANYDARILSEAKKDLIVFVVGELLAKFSEICNDQNSTIRRRTQELANVFYEDYFPLTLWQTGSGTASNMNVNEVIVKLASEVNPSIKMHPNDDVNLSQSSNDVFPTACHISAYRLSKQLLRVLTEVIDTLICLREQFGSVVAVGRTHLQDATNIFFADQLFAYQGALEQAVKDIEYAADQLLEVPLGGTAIGTGINTPIGFSYNAVKYLGEITGHPYRETQNKYYLQSHRHALVGYSASLANLASDLLKMSNDIRFRASGPRAGLGEIEIPANEAGSSIMPGKVNPTQAEMLSQICVQVMGNNSTIGFASSQGNFELNTYMPVMIYNVLQSSSLLRDGLDSFNKRLLSGLRPNQETLAKNVEQSLMSVTALNPHIGYDKAAKVCKHAIANDMSVLESAKIVTDLDHDHLHNILTPMRSVGEMKELLDNNYFE